MRLVLGNIHDGGLREVGQWIKEFINKGNGSPLERSPRPCHPKPQNLHQILLHPMHQCLHQRLHKARLCMEDAQLVH